jgi:hypothetical protein
MVEVQLRNDPFGRGVWGVVVAALIALVLVLAYLEGPGSLTRGAFAFAALVLLWRQVQVLRRGRDRT